MTLEYNSIIKNIYDDHKNYNLMIKYYCNLSNKCCIFYIKIWIRNFFKENLMIFIFPYGFDEEHEIRHDM